MRQEQAWPFFADLFPGQKVNQWKSGMKEAMVDALELCRGTEAELTRDKVRAK
jgi:hypothetical protein